LLKSYNDIPLNDKKTYESLANSNNTGIFQVSSSGMSKLMNQLKPTNISEIGAIIALYRPGPLDSGATAEYMLRRDNPEAIVYDHPKLESILKETYGLFVFQEQIISTCIHLGGFSETEGDKIRKVMGKKEKDPSILNPLKDSFIQGCIKNEIKKRIADIIWDKMIKFSDYGFNKAHSIGYAYLTYYTAYLKTNYPVEFYASLLNTAIGKKDELQKYITSALNKKITILFPDIEKSESFCTIENNKIRLGFLFVHSIGSKSIEIIKNNRNYEKCLHVLPHDNIEYLIKAGAFDKFNKNRHELYSRFAHRTPIKGKRVGRGLFSINSNFNIGEWKQIQKINYQYDALGFYLGDNPLTSKLRPHKEFIQRGGYFLKKTFKSLKPEEKIKILLMVTKIKPIKTKRGDDMAFCTCLDIWGQIVDCVFFPETYDMFPPSKDQIYEMIGYPQDPNELKLIISATRTIDQVLGE